MSVLERIIKNRKKLVEVEKRRDIIKELSNLINQLDIDIEKKKKLKLSKAIKTAKEIKNPIITFLMYLLSNLKSCFLQYF